MSGLSLAPHPTTHQSPSLDNQSADQWEQHAQLAFLFARHARHDLANIHCALGMLEMVEQIQAENPEQELPEELQPHKVREKSRLDIKRIISISNDLIMLSQASSTAAYRPAHTANLSDLIVQYIADRMGSENAPPNKLLETTAQLDVLTLGDMLGPALSTFYCQWTPWLHSHENAANATADLNDGQIYLTIPADDTELISHWGLHLNQTDHCPITQILSENLTASTAELALWLARHIILIHGGNVTVQSESSTPQIQITLPHAQ